MARFCVDAGCCSVDCLYVDACVVTMPALVPTHVLVMLTDIVRLVDVPMHVIALMIVSVMAPVVVLIQVVVMMHVLALMCFPLLVACSVVWWFVPMIVIALVACYCADALFMFRCMFLF